ncbi:hypothetical protein QTH91_05885 [Variovorax dokdonensis]|uniref:Uncharacterized protein n=1 Tax=Variovorax dokdonensis TaxID=344883 RepID=A0ABT7N7T7_9BURK|nr:hypothetical protein [Variovorax dokdonensis]MDM0044004.1 hypothetical protein [Variovorax dokdonensis]
MSEKQIGLLMEPPRTVSEVNTLLVEQGYIEREPGTGQWVLTSLGAKHGRHDPYGFRWQRSMSKRLLGVEVG